MTNIAASSSRRLRFNAHVVAYNKHQRDNAAPAEEIVVAGAPLDAEAFEIPGENPVTLSEGEFEELLSKHLEGDENALEGLDAADEAIDGEDAIEDEGDVPDAGASFEERLALVGDEEAKSMVWDIANRIDDRLARAINDAPVKIKNLKRARAKMVTGRVASVLCAAGVADASFVNRQWRDGSEFNVYALFKLPDLANGLVGGVIANAINIAVVKSMFALEKAGIPFDFDTAKAAASSEHAPKRQGVRQHLTRHTVAKGTASTQAGSTMHALMALGVVSFVPSQNPTYTILQNATTEALRNAKFEIEEDEA